MQDVIVANANLAGGPGIRVDSTPQGHALSLDRHQPPSRRFELAAALTYPGSPTSPPFTTAKYTNWEPSSAEFVESGSSPTLTLYYPTAIMSGANYIGLPKLRAGLIVKATFERGIWIIDEPEMMHAYWGVLDVALTFESSATVSIYTGQPRVDSTINVTAYDGMLKTSADSIDAEIWVLVKWFRDDGVWWVTEAQCD
jgi:hypothetical protein